MTFSRLRKKTEKGASGESLLEPKSLKIGAGAPPNRSGADSGNCGRGGDLRRNAETRPGAQNGKKVEKRGPKRDPKREDAQPFFALFFPPRSRPSPEGVPGRLLEPFGSILESFSGVSWLDFRRCSAAKSPC